MSMPPIMFDKPKTSPDIPWELVGQGKTTKLRRVKVPGGWLYQTKESGGTGIGIPALAFVSAADVLADPTVTMEQKQALGLLPAADASA